MNASSIPSKSPDGQNVQCFIRCPAEIHHFLLRLIREKTPLQVSVEKEGVERSWSASLTHLLQSQNMMVVDFPLLDVPDLKKNIKLSGRCSNNVNFSFETTLPETYLVVPPGSNGILATIPESVHYPQNREFYRGRIHSSVTAHLSCPHVLNPLSGQISDFSPGGAGIVVPQEAAQNFSVGDLWFVDICTKKKSGQIIAEVRHKAMRGAGNLIQIGVKFKALSPEQRHWAIEFSRAVELQERHYRT